jgi:hypothetical protein
VLNYALCHEDIWGSIGTAPRSLTSALDGSDVQLHALAALRPGKCSLYALERKLDGPQSRCGCFGVEKKFLAPAESRTRVVHLVAHRYTD